MLSSLTAAYQPSGRLSTRFANDLANVSNGLIALARERPLMDMRFGGHVAARPRSVDRRLSMNSGALSLCAQRPADASLDR